MYGCNDDEIAGSGGSLESFAPGGRLAAHGGRDGRHAVELSTSKTTCLPKTSATVCGTLSRLRLRGAFRARRFALRRSQSTEWFTIPNSMHATGAIGQHLQSRTRS